MKSFDIVTCKASGKFFGNEYIIVSYGEQEDGKYANLIDITGKDGSEIMNVINNMPINERDTDLSVETSVLKEVFEFKSRVRI